MRKKRFSPIITFIFLTILVIVLSGVLSFFGVQAEYNTVNSVTNEINNNIVEVENLFSGSGLRYIVTNAVSDFVGFAPLSMLIIVLMGIGILESTGFIRTLFTIITQHSRKNILTFFLIFFSILSSLTGDLSFVVMLPIGALLYKYGKRNPLGGIIASFAGVSFGYSVNIFLNAVDSSLLTITTNAAHILDKAYSINDYFSLFIMIVVFALMSFIFTNITEKNIMSKLSKYEFTDEENDFRITNKELRGLIVGLIGGFLYVALIVYMIIPGLPLSGTLLDASATKYIDMLFGANSLFNQGFVFIITLLFVIVGLLYGIMTKTIKDTKDFTKSIAHSLDGIGIIIVLIFFVSLFISVFKKSNIGFVISASLISLIQNLNLTGIGLIVVFFIVCIISTILVPSQISRWTMFAGTIVPLFMNASLSPEFAQIIFNAGNSVAYGITPLLAYFVVYLALLEKYNQEEMITLKKSLRYMVPYSVSMVAVWFVVLIGWYIIGVPIGIHSYPGVTYVS